MILYPSYIPLSNYYSVHNVMSVLFCHACTTFSHDYSYSTWRYLYGSFNLVTFRCLCCSFLCMLCIHHHGHDHMTIVLEDACTVLFRTWWVFECLLPIMRWKLEPDDLVWDSEPAAEMKADNWRNRAASAASCLISRNRIRPFKFQQFFIQHNKNSFFGFVCQLIQQQHLKRLEACFLDLGMVS